MSDGCWYWLNIAAGPPVIKSIGKRKKKEWKEKDMVGACDTIATQI